MRKIRLTTKKELNIFMSPVRQQLLRILTLADGPMTPKMLSDRLEISPSSVQHHLRKLLELGIVELSHTEEINGITARYYRPAEVSVQIGLEDSNELTPQKQVLMQNILAQVYDGFREQMGKRRGSEPTWGDLQTGALHLKDEDAARLMQMVKEYIEQYARPGVGTNPWELAFIFYKAGDQNND